MDGVLKACPFCGKAVEITTTSTISGIWRFTIECSNFEDCEINPSLEGCKTEEEAFKIWNRRY